MAVSSRFVDRFARIVSLLMFFDDAAYSLRMMDHARLVALKKACERTCQAFNHR
jgi:hypothetical protein